jgi:imidazolonepropionase-like amidohydrolase
LPWDVAFAAVSRGPAAIFGAGPLGRKERNNKADVVIWDGDPLQVTSAPTAVFIEGVEQSLSSRQTQLRDRYNPRRNR